MRPPSFQTRLMSRGVSASSGDSGLQYLPLLIGNHVRIGDNCIIECASIGSSVVIGRNCVIGKRVLIKDHVVIQEGTVLADDTVIPPFSRVGGCPGKILSDFWDRGGGDAQNADYDNGLGVVTGGMLPESVAVEYVNQCAEKFSEFVKGLEGSNESPPEGEEAKSSK